MLKYCQKGGKAATGNLYQKKSAMHPCAMRVDEEESLSKIRRVLSHAASGVYVSEKWQATAAQSRYN